MAIAESFRADVSSISPSFWGGEIQAKSYYNVRLFKPPSLSQIVRLNYRSSEAEELFRHRIEAPNKTDIFAKLFKGYDNRVRPNYRGGCINIDGGLMAQMRRSIKTNNKKEKNYINY